MLSGASTTSATHSPSRSDNASSLGPTKTSTNDAQTRGTENIVAAIKKHGVRRLVTLTGAWVSDPKDRPKLFDRVMGALLKRLQRDVLADAEGHARVIQDSGLDWVIVRGPVLTRGRRRASTASATSARTVVSKSRGPTLPTSCLSRERHHASRPGADG